MEIILCVVLGGCAVQGGKGSVWGTIIGVLFYGILSAGFTSLHMSQYLQWVVMGAIMLFALSLDVLKGKGVKLWKRKVMAAKAEQKKTLIRLFKDNNSVLILVIMLFVAFVFVDGYSSGFYNVIKYTAMYGPVCLGLGLVMITGNIDLSAGFQAGLAGVTSVIFFNAVYRAGNPVLSLVIAIIGCLITGVITGIINGFFWQNWGVGADCHHCRQLCLSGHRVLLRPELLLPG